jgi:hypothetical protein
VLSRGDDWTFAQNISHVVRFLGLRESAEPALAPDQLMARLKLFVRTAITIVPQMPDALMGKEVPNRPRSYLNLGHHLFRIPEGMMEVAAGATLTNEMLTGGPPDDMRTSAGLGLYGTQVLAGLHRWWDPMADKSGRETVQSYYGPQRLHEVLERTTWHCGQHVRQWFMLLDLAGIAPAAKLEDHAFSDLPMPSSVWD